MYNKKVAIGDFFVMFDILAGTHYNKINSYHRRMNKEEIL